MFVTSEKLNFDLLIIKINLKSINLNIKIIKII